jgi:hypothetical protein
MWRGVTRRCHHDHDASHTRIQGESPIVVNVEPARVGRMRKRCNALLVVAMTGEPRIPSMGR